MKLIKKTNHYFNSQNSSSLPSPNQLSYQKSARAGFWRPGPARPVGLKARPVTARGPELSLGPGPFRPVACPSPARPGPARPDKRSFQGISWNYSIKWWILLNAAYLTNLLAIYT